MKNIQDFNQFINEGISYDFGNSYSIADNITKPLTISISTQFYGNLQNNILEYPFDVIIDIDGVCSLWSTDLNVEIATNLFKNNYKYSDLIKDIKTFFKNNVKVASYDYIEKNYDNIKIDSDINFDKKTGFSLTKTLAVKSGVKLNELEMPPFYIDVMYRIRDYKSDKSISNPLNYYTFYELIDEIKNFYKIK